MARQYYRKRQVLDRAFGEPADTEVEWRNRHIRIEGLVGGQGVCLIERRLRVRRFGHRTRSMLDRYNIVSEAETAAALELADRYLSAQPTVRNVEEGQFEDSRTPVGAKVLTGQRQLAEAGGNRTHRSGGQPGAGRL